jgi:hypothetical protein
MLFSVELYCSGYLNILGKKNRSNIMKKAFIITAVLFIFSIGHCSDNQESCTFLIVSNKKTFSLIEQLFKSNPQNLEKYDFLKGHKRTLQNLNKDVSGQSVKKMLKLIDFTAKRHNTKINIILPVEISSCSLVVDEKNSNAIGIILPCVTRPFVADLSRAFEDVDFSYRLQFGDDIDEKKNKDFKLKSSAHSKADTISPNDLKKYIRFAATAAAAYKSQEDWVTPFGLKLIKPESEIFIEDLNGISRMKYCFFKETSGLKAIVCSNKNQIIVTYGAFGSAFPEAGSKKYKIIASYLKNTIVHNVYFGSVPTYYDEADFLFNKIKEYYAHEGKEFVLTGQCLGGSIAQYVGMKNKVKTICFNAIPLGSGLQQKIGADSFDANKYITEIFVDDNPMISSNSARTFGREYVIPSAYDTSLDSHKFVMGSLLQYIGYSKKSHTKDLKPEDLICD